MSELLAALGIDDATDAVEIDPVQASTAEPVAPPSDTVYEIDAWTARRGSEVLADSERLAHAVHNADMPRGGTPPPPASVKATTRRGRRGTEDADDVPPPPIPDAARPYWESVTADAYAAAFDPSAKPAANPADKLRAEYFDALRQTDEFREMRVLTQFDAVTSEVAAVAYAEKFAERLAQQRTDDAAAKSAASRSGPRGSKPRESIGSDPAVKTAGCAAAAAAAAKKEVEDCRDAASACGMGDGSDGSKLDAKKLLAVHKRVKKSPNLRKIMEQAGRFRRVAQSKQRNKVTHGMDDIVGVTVGGEIERLLPAELSRLVLPELELDTLRRIVEREAQVRDHRGVEPAGKGPIVVVVDESGSMSGDKVETAKGLALAMAWIAKSQRRWCALIGFSGGTEGNTLLLPPTGGWDEQAVLDWLEHFYGGGTQLDVPLIELPTVTWPKIMDGGANRGKTDILMLTDAIVGCDDELAASFNAWRTAEKARVTILVLPSGEIGELAKVCDDHHKIERLKPDGEEVGTVLSV